MNQKKYALILSALFLITSQFSLAQTPSYSDEECLFCHGKPEISQILSNGRTRSLYVDPEEWNQDIHHTGKVFCVSCHTNANPYLHFREGFIDVDCARCHPEEAEEYEKNVHLTFAAPSPGKELPLCFHCHTKHHVLRHDDPSSSVHEKNIGDTCGSCHAEVMIKSLFKGRSLGKISGHRKGDLSEKFDMKVCISCHYDDSAHEAKWVFKDFCSRCHNVSSTASFIMGPTHLDSQRFTWLNLINSGLLIVMVLGMGLFVIYRSRKEIADNARSWLERMRIQEKEIEEPEAAEETAKEEPKPELTAEPTPEEPGAEDQESQPEKTDETAPIIEEERKKTLEQEQKKEEAEEEEPGQEGIKEEESETEKATEDQNKGQIEDSTPEDQIKEEAKKQEGEEEEKEGQSEER